MNKKGIFIASLNSIKLAQAIHHKNASEFSESIEGLDIFVFDILEVLNGIFFNENNVEQQKNIIEDIIDKLQEQFVSVNPKGRKLVRCSQKRKELNPYVLAVYTEYYTNSSFESHCKNQIYQNLQPKLNRLSIKSKRTDVIELLVPFLLMEIAVFLAIFHKGEYHKIYGMEHEMEIVSAIKKGKYTTFNNFLVNEVEYIKMPEPQYA